MYIRLFIIFMLFGFFTGFKKKDKQIKAAIPINTVSKNLIIITIDGFRWQEVFKGADSIILADINSTTDTALAKLIYWNNNTEARRKMLMPFIWNVVAQNGQLIGNREYGSQMNVANFWSVSYPGYNEMFTGNTDFTIFSNAKKQNKNKNVFAFLNEKEEFKGKIAAFTSWDVLPYVLNETKSNFTINAGNEVICDNNITLNEEKINILQSKKSIYENTRNDALTFFAAKEYLQKNQPRVLYIGLGECDEYAHSNKYDMYLEKARQADRMIAELWYYIQTNKNYKDSTTLIITTDHGRGNSSNNWNSHGLFSKGSSQTWLAALGPGINALGEVKEAQQIYTKQVPQTIAKTLGQSFTLSMLK
jgi:hypothetical protein